MKYDLDLPVLPKEKRYTVRVGNYLHKRLHKHLTILKHVDHTRHYVKNWVIEAIKEKLEEEDKNPSIAISEQKFIVINLNDTLGKRVEEKVACQRKFRESYSKKQWFVEAIQEKLEREEYKTRKFLDELSQKNNAS